MIRRGEYTEIDDKEFRVIIRDRNGKSYLISDHKEEGFKEYSNGIYEKEINLKELNNLYYINSKAKYKNQLFHIRNFIKNRKVCIGTSDATIAKKYNLERTDKYFYEKWVPIEEVEIIEERKDISLK